MEKFQLYKVAREETYSNCSEVAKMEIVGSDNSDEFSLANMKGPHMLYQDGRALTDEELMGILKSTLGSKSLARMSSLILEDGLEDGDVVEQCKQFGKSQADEDSSSGLLLSSGMTSSTSRGSLLLKSGMTAVDSFEELETILAHEELEGLLAQKTHHHHGFKCGSSCLLNDSILEQ